MINRIIEYSVKNKLIIALSTLGLIVAGIWSMSKVPIDAVPDITNNQVQIITQAPNLGTEDIEQFVTYPVEISMSNLPGVVEIRSISRFGLSLVTVVFDDEIGTYLPRQLVAEKLEVVKQDIPEGFGEPYLGPISTGLGEIYQYTLDVDPIYQEEYSTTDLRTFQDWIIRRQMSMVPGVVEVNSFGGNIKQYEVAVSPEELKAIDLTIADIYSALERNNRNTGGAYIEKNHQANFIRGEGLARDLDDIGNIVIKTSEGIPIRIKDVAKVQFGSAIRYGAFTKNAQGEAVGGMIMMLKGANSAEVIGAVKERMEEIQKSLPEGISINPFLDRSKLISDTTSTVKSNLLEGGLIVIFVLVILLGNWRGGLIVASTIPLSLLFAFILMHAFDVWANLMSLGAIDFGIIVDGAVIIVESTVFLLYKKVMGGKKITREEKDKLTIESSKKMMNSAFFGQLIILIVFIPILALEGIEGKMFHPMALTFIFAMIGAMILCLTYVPMVSSVFIKIRAKEKKSFGDKIIHWLEDKYDPLLQGALKKGKWVIAFAVVLLGVAVFTYTRLGGEFIPQLDEGDIAFHVILKPGSSLTESIETSTKVEKILLENFPEVKHAMTKFGVSDVPTDPMPMDIGDCFAILKPKEEWVSADSKEELIEKMKEKLSILPGISYEFTQPIEMRFNELITGVREDIAIKLFGEDLGVLAAKANEIGGIISDIEGIGDMRVEATTGLPQMTINYQQSKLAQYGLNVEELNKTIETAFAGGKAGVIFEGEKRFHLVVRLDSSYRKNIDDVRQLYINTPDGAQIPLKEIAEISYKPGPMQISRDNTNRRVNVGINVRGRDVESLVKEIQERLDTELNLPPGYYIRYGGAFENLQRASDKLKMVVPIALTMIFILIYFALGSFRQTMIIYIAIPLAAIGGVYSLWLRDMSFSISAGVGFIVLFGVAVLNGLVMMNGLNELKSEGEHDLDNRIKQGTKRRIRPILLTALTDILGFLPMAVSTSSGAEVQRPLATVVIGGLITSTLLTLFILPILYRWVESSSVTVNPKKVMVTGFLLISFFVAGVNSSHAQDDSLKAISLSEAREMALQKYPAIKAARLEVESEEALKKTAWQLGNTQVFNSGEELRDGTGVYTTIGVQQQNIDLFGIPSNINYQKSRIALAESALDLSEAQLKREVGLSYGDLVVAMKYLSVYDRLDSVFRNFEKAAQLRYETQEISKLEWMSAVSQVKRIALKKQEARADYQMALQKFNLWLVSDTIFTATDIGFNDLNGNTVKIENHPSIVNAKEELNVAEAAHKNSRSEWLPRLNGQYGWQEINGVSGFHTYQIGISIPLSFLETSALVQSQKIRKEQSQENYHAAQRRFQLEYQNANLEFEKWSSSWRFYESEVLPLSREQRKAAILAFGEGGISYTSFVQNINESLKTEEEAWNALENYLQSYFDLEYYLNNNVE